MQKTLKSIFFADGGTAVAYTFGPSQRKALTQIARDFGAARVGQNDPTEVRFTYGGLNTADRSTLLWYYRQVGSSYYRKYTANGQSYIFKCDTKAKAEKLRDAFNAIRGLGNKVASVTETTTGDSQYASVGYREIESKSGSMRAVYHIPYSKTKNEEARESAENDEVAANARNNAATLDAQTEELKAATKKSKLVRYAAVAVVAVAVIWAVIYFVKHKKK